MKKLLAIAIAALLMAPIASAQQGNLPKPVQKLPAYPPVVCVAPNWATESCEERADDPWSLKPLWKFLKMLDESWLATADKWDKPRPWNGAWPNHLTVLYHEPGGELRKNVKRWQELANSKDDVEIRGTCVSGCTMIMAYVPKARICFGENASLWFHRAQVQYENGVLVPDYATTAWMVSRYPPDIRRWIMDKGGPANMTVRDFRELSAGDLWEMGYRKCAPELPPPETYPPPPMEIKSTKTVEFPTYVETEADKQRGKDDEEKWREKDRKAEEFWRQWQADKATQ